MKLAVILLCILGKLYGMLLQIVQYRSAGNPTPAGVADVYDAETYRRWKAYSREKCRLQMISTAISCALSVGLLASDAYARFASLFPEGMIGQMFAVVLLEVGVGVIAGVAISYADTIVIEGKYGFNRSTKKTFVLDQIRSLLVGLLLSAALVSLYALAHRLAGDFMILLFAAGLFGFTLLISFLFPLFSRLGNKFTLLEEGELRDRLSELMQKHGYKVRAIEVMDASRRTTKLNAYFTGFGKLKTIVLYDNLVNAMSTDEICAVFAHEMGHGLHRDVLKQQILNLGNLLLMAVLAWLAVRSSALYTAFGFTAVNYGFAYVLLGVGLELLQPFTGIVTNAYSRHAEYRADRQAVREGYGAAMITALKKLAKENFAHLSPSPTYVVLEYSHPPLAARIEAVERAMESDALPS
ncbi:MAG: M48 family metallopeptidase [Clostridia bacterium]|nr:M48 family metallopeptidase [Clostridia bacterium]